MRRLIFSICLLLCVLTAGADIYSIHKAADQNASSGAASGIWQYGKETSPYVVDLYLAGDWEYYPGMLIYTDMDRENFQGGIGVMDPIPRMDLSYDPANVDAEHLAEVRTRDQSDYQPESLEAIPLPAHSVSHYYNHPRDQVSSYRILAEGLPPTEDFDMILGLQGLIYGDYELYIDGNHVTAMAAPYGYPSYYFPVDASGQVEFVLQTRNTTSLLNITPRISFKGTAMGNFDTYRNIILILTAILCTAFIIMMVLMFSLERRYLYLPFFTGLAFTGNYLANNLWATGYQGAITSLVPQYLVPHIAWLLLAVGTFLAGSFYRRVSTDTRMKQVSCVSMAVLGLSLIVRLLHLAFFGAPALLVISDGLTGAALLLLLITTYWEMNRIARSSYLFEAGFFLMVFGSLISQLQNGTGISNPFLFAQPLTIMVFLVLVFYNNKVNQRDILARTRELLEIEKQSSKIQTAMLSSQIQPHFLYNTLTTIQELCYSDPDEAAELIVTFSQYLRSNLDFMNYEDLIPFSRELDHIHNFMYIQNARYKNAIDYEEDLETTDFLLPPLSVQPIVENAVKHGIMKEHARGHISLKVYRAENAIHIQVRNDGERFTEADLKKGHSMDNIRTRLTHLVGGALLFHFDDPGDETCVEVVIPLG